MQIEFHQLELRYQHLRMSDPARLKRLMASLVEHGQQSPVMVVQGESAYVLIDGYLRVQALRALRQDVVDAVLVDLGEADALLYRYAQLCQSRRSALEDAWLLSELTEQHGMSQAELSARLCRSVSWVSRRLGLLRELPSEGHELVRQAWICEHAAMKYLVPLARAKRGDCQLLIGALMGCKVTERQLGRLYKDCRRATAEQWRAIVANLRLYLKASQSSEQAAPLQGTQGRLIGALRRLKTACQRMLSQVAEIRSRAEVLSPQVAQALNKATTAFIDLKTTLEEHDVELRDTDGHLAAGQSGAGTPAHCAAAQSGAQLRQESPC